MPLKKILVTLCGTSPAVITETLYSLVNSSPTFVPDEIIAITTVTGRQAICSELFDSNIWDELLKDLQVQKEKCLFGPASTYIRIIPDATRRKDADDIVTDKDNEAAADFIMETIRQYTENPDTEIVLSIAGGRKTMSALAALAISMLGREQDKLCHVLVDPPFDSPSLKPKFYYPAKIAKLHKSPDGKFHSSDDAKITLCEIPFVRLRNLFIKQHLRLPGTFSDTVNLANSVIRPENIKMPELTLRPDSYSAMINDIDLAFSPPEFAMYWLLALRAKNGSPPIRGQKELADEFSKFCLSTSSKIMKDIANFANKSDEQLRKVVHSLSNKIKKALGGEDFLPYCLPQRDEGLYGIALPKKNIHCPRNTD